MGSTLRLLAFALLVTAPLHGQTLQDHLRNHGKPPLEYLLSKLVDHRIVIVGEAHWQRKDAELIAAIVPELRRRNVALATELLAGGATAERPSDGVHGPDGQHPLADLR